MKKAFGTDEILALMTEQNAKLMARMDDQSRQIKALSDSVTYVNHQLLEIREKFDHLEISTRKAAEKPARRERIHSENPVEAKVLESVSKSGSITASEAALLSGLSRTRASEVLNSLVRKRLILKEKHGKTSFFVPTPDVSTERPGGGAETT